MRVLIIGCGSIGNVLAKAAQAMPEVDSIFFTDRSEQRASARAMEYSKGKVTSYDDASIIRSIKEVDLVIEAASQDAARRFTPMCLERGRDIMVMSVGVFHDDAFRTASFDLARKNRARLYIPSGAVCGTDGLRSAHGRIDEVHLTTTKAPTGFQDVQYLKDKGVDVNKLTRPTVLYEGPARDCVKKFPQSINIAAALSLAGIGFEATKIRILADPGVTRNTHEIHCRSRAGRAQFVFENVPVPANPKTTYLACLSVLAALKNIRSPYRVGT